MPRSFDCPYLGAGVDLTDEREAHIRRRHPDVLHDNLALLTETLAAPDTVRISPQDPTTLLFSRWYDDLLGGKYLNVVVKVPGGSDQRNWILTSHPSGSALRGEILWTRS